MEGRNRRERAVEGAGEVGHRHADLHRPAAALGTGDRHEPAHPLRHDVEPGPLRVGTVLAPARSGDIDEPRIQLRQPAVVELEIGHGARTEVLHHHIRALDQAAEHFLPPRELEVQGEGSLVSIEPDETRGFALEERSGGAHLVATVWVLDLHHLGAEIGELERAEWRRHEVADFDDAHAGQRGLGHGAPLHRRASRAPS